MRALQIAATGMLSQQTRVDTISNNIANVNTTGYNARRAEFADLMYQQAERAGTVSSDAGTLVPAGVQIGLGTRTAAISMNVMQGTLRQTENDLDVAIEGQGYFEITLPNGESAFTRDGSFKMSAEGVIVNSSGYTVVPEIVVPVEATDIAINADGEVYAYFDDQPEAQLLGQVELATFINEKGLRAIGSNLFVPSEASGDPLIGNAGEEGRGIMRQGYLESSSVNVVFELTQLIEAQRGYEMNSKVITASDEMMATAGRIR